MKILNIIYVKASSMNDGYCTSGVSKLILLLERLSTTV